MTVHQLSIARQIRSTLLLGSIFFLRMFGLFLMVPVLSLYSSQLKGATPLLIGLALGIYGLTQGLLQIPLGMLSDRIGRKPVICAGLILFILGSVIAMWSDHIMFVVIGRALQGAGAIAAAIMALISDSSDEQFRTRAMAVIGMSIGMAFVLAMVLGPIIGGTYGLDGVFIVAAGLALFAILLLLLVPRPPEGNTTTREMSSQDILLVFKNRQLLPYHLGVLFLHMILMSTFVAIPLVLQQHTTLADADHWQMYLPVMVLSAILMVPFILKADDGTKFLRLYPLATLVILFSQISFLIWHQSWLAIASSLILFFTAFNFMEASLPATISKLISAEFRGTALGIFATSQFFGAFLGGLGGGFGYGMAGFQGVFIFNLLVACIWLFYIYRYFQITSKA